MDDIVAVTYQHDHNCSRQGQTVTQRPPCGDGVAWVAAPFCIEAGMPLVKIEWRTA